MQTGLKFRHVYGQVQKQKYENVVRTTANSEACGLKGNSEVIGISTKSGGGGVLTILPNNGCRKIEADLPAITGHQGSVQDFDFYPFEAGYVATASEDTHVRLWQFPKDGVLTKNITDPIVDLQGHGKKVLLVQWNRTSSNILASGSADKTVKVWNVQNSAQVLNYELSDSLTSLDWNLKGALIGATTKDKQLYVIDPRQQTTALQTECHEGTKSTKFIWLGETGYGLTTGFASTQERQFKIWDLRNAKSAVDTVKVDNTSGILFPHFDEDVGMLYLAGKGDGNIRYYEFQEGGKLTYLNQFQSTTSGSLYGFYPKRVVDTRQCELVRVLKVSDKNLEFISFIAPRKSGSEVFQTDIYPNCVGDTAAQSGEAWFSGKTVDPIRISLEQGYNRAQTDSGFQKLTISNQTQQNKESQQVSQSNYQEEKLLEEIAKLNSIIEVKDARIRELEAQLAQQNGSNENQESQE